MHSSRRGRYHFTDTSTWSTANDEQYGSNSEASSSDDDDEEEIMFNESGFGWLTRDVGSATSSSFSATTTSENSFGLPQCVTELLTTVPMSEASEDFTCVICLEGREVEKDSEGELHTIKKLPCGHQMHTSCIDAWLKTDITCPSCRAKAFDMNHLFDIAPGRPELQSWILKYQEREEITARNERIRDASRQLREAAERVSASAAYLGFSGQRYDGGGGGAEQDAIFLQTIILGNVARTYQGPSLPCELMSHLRKIPSLLVDEDRPLMSCFFSEQSQIN